MLDGGLLGSYNTPAIQVWQRLCQGREKFYGCLPSYCSKWSLGHNILGPRSSNCLPLDGSPPFGLGDVGSPCFFIHRENFIKVTTTKPRQTIFIISFYKILPWQRFLGAHKNYCISWWSHILVQWLWHQYDGSSSSWFLGSNHLTTEVRGLHFGLC